MALLLLFPFPEAAHAQVPRDTTARSDTTTRADSSRPVQLGRIVVRALRVPTELRAAPYAIARNGADVTRRARPGLALSEALHGAPGVQVDNRYNFALGERITVRGFGARTQFGVRGVRVLVDGVPATLPDGQTTLNHLDLGTIESIEVVRAPVSALYGNAAGGVIAIETRAPPDEPLAGSARVVAGSHGLLRRQISMGGRSPSGTYQLDLARLSYDGYRAHNDADNRYLHTRSRTELGQTRLELAANVVRYDARNPGALPDSLLVRDRTAAFPSNVAQNTGERGKQAQVSLSVRSAGTGHATTVVLFGVRRDIDNPIPPRVIDLSRRAGGARVSFGTSDPERRLGWDAGMETQLQTDERRNYVNVAGERGALTLDQRERVRSFGAFATARAQLTSRASVQAGLRRDVINFIVTDRLIAAGNPDDSGGRQMRAWNPSFGISVEVCTGTRLFANVGTAFETPTTTELGNRENGAGGLNPDLEPQRSLSHEVGVNGSVQGAYYQVALYRARVSDALVPFEVPATPGRQFFRNAASALHSGAEVMVAGSLAAVSARVAYTFTRARYREYAVAGASYAGRLVPGIAPHRVESLVRYERGRTFIDWETRYQSREPVNDANAAYSSAYAIHGVRGGIDEIRWARLRLSPFAAAENVLNREYNTSVVINAAGGRFFEPGPGRTFYVGFDVSAQ